MPLLKILFQLIVFLYQYNHLKIINLHLADYLQPKIAFINLYIDHVSPHTLIDAYIYKYTVWSDIIFLLWNIKNLF